MIMWFERDLKYDLWLIMAVVGLVGIGIVMIYSTSSIAADHLYQGNGTFFLKKQLISAGIGTIAMFAAMHFNYEKLKYLVPIFLIGSAVMLVLVLIPGIGTEVNGGRRWLRILGFSFQPSEFARLTLIIYLAVSLARKGELIESFTYGLLPYLVLAGFFMGLILIEPDMGGAMTIGILLFIMLFVAGAKIRYLLGMVAVAVPMAFYFIVSEAYRWQRLLATINPWDYLHTAGWQLVQSLLAFGSGGILGVGLGQGRQKLFYLPDAHTDFIFSVIGEEFGFVGVIVVLALFGAIAVRGVVVSVRSSTPTGTYLAFGITMMIIVPALINMMVVMGLLPTKGLVLPFVSYGGTALIMNMTAAGILLNVSSKMYRTT